MKKMTQERPSWKPKKKGSDGARMYHNAVIKAEWNLDNLEILAQIFDRLDKEKKVIIDFGAGTGASSVYLKEHIKSTSELCLVDNSPSWLTVAYELLGECENVKFHIIGKQGEDYETLSDVIGNKVADVVVSANTFHLILDINSAISGIYDALRPEGYFLFQSGNIIREDRNEDLLMIDSTIEEIHTIAIDIIKNEDQFKEYRQDIDEQISQELGQRKMIFPTPRPISQYISAMEGVGFKNIDVTYKKIYVKYEEWKIFLGVNRIQAGILPEVGGRFPTDKELEDRITIIKLAVDKYFKELSNHNSLADENGFMAEWVYLQGEKLI